MHVYSVTGTHSGVTDCLSCHGPGRRQHLCQCHHHHHSGDAHPDRRSSIAAAPAATPPVTQHRRVQHGAASVDNPTLDVAGHTTVAAAVPACQTCHQTAPYHGMIASTASAAGDSRRPAFDKGTPDLGRLRRLPHHLPTFATNVDNSAQAGESHSDKRACTQCHTTPGNYALYSVTGTHQGVTGCVSCHGPSVATTFANITITTTPGNHIPIGALDCNGSGLPHHRPTSMPAASTWRRRASTAHTQHRRAHHGRSGGASVPDVPRDGALSGHGREHRRRRG